MQLVRFRVDLGRCSLGPGTPRWRAPRRRCRAHAIRGEVVRRYNLATRRIEAVARSALTPLMARVASPVRKSRPRARARSVKPAPRER